ncbi:hypothetical protein GPECTOR_8g290 [Gonium pectorale]|uniref:Uncharacterized protein n=1 Tax=Gonium pectorale TaxID=33097 RepID=A0A150GT62_GONPE|nr:hypothetical protein GPECTOR_8g290 [Gonium pectorale]|eukprot:KXZ52912.1 hypothetical protein GPECTOR_8g290 [Gonium pectorale]
MHLRLVEAMRIAGVVSARSLLAGKLASNIAAMYSSLSDRMHPFVGPWGLKIYQGVPDEVTTLALECIAKHYCIPYKVVEELAATEEDA